MADCPVNGETIASIGRGLFILVGVDKSEYRGVWTFPEVQRKPQLDTSDVIDDDASDMNPIIKKVLDAKLFEDDQGGLWKQTIKECDGEILCGEHGCDLVQDGQGADADGFSFAIHAVCPVQGV